MPLTVLNVAYPLAPVGPDAVGGAEQIVAALDESLVRAGHQSLVIACEGSRCRGTLIATPRSSGRLDEAARADAQGAHRRAIAWALRNHPVDVVHVHGVDFEHYLPTDGPPVVATLHLPPSWYGAGALRPARNDVALVCVSASQRQALPAGVHTQLIPNGVAVERFRFRERKRGYAFALGRVCPEKGFHHALDAAALADIALALAGEVFAYPEHVEYFRRTLQPRLDLRRRFVGPVGFARKRRLLAGARCLLVPSLAPETSSLVAMEALASGTPTVAFAAGALPEIVDHGVTGFIARSVDEMARGIGEAQRIRPADCRRAAEDRFSHAAMTARYLEVYGELAGRSRGSTRWRIDELTTPAQIEAARDEWLSLWERSPSATPFQHPDWLLAWCRAFQPHAPWVLALRRAGRLEGIAPLVVFLDSEGARTVGLLGGGVSDYADLIVSGSCELEGGSQLLAHLYAQRDRWDRCDLEPLRGGSPLLARVPPSFAGETILDQVSTALPIGGGGDPRARIPRRTLDRLAYYRRRLARLGFTPTGPDVLERPDEVVGELVRLHRARWQSRGEPGVLADERLERFHRDVARAFGRHGMLTVNGLVLDGEWVAIAYGFIAKRRRYVYLTGLDPAHERLSLGAVVLGDAIDSAIARGAVEVDMLRGREAYKRSWGVEERPLYRRRIRDARAESAAGTTARAPA